MNIRPETPAEFTKIYKLVEEAFKTAKVSNGDEQNFVDRLRASQNYIPELALVAEEQGRLIGHVMLTHMTIKAEQGLFSLLLLGPLAVVMDRRGERIGRSLVAEGCALAKRAGHSAVLLVGDPAYYGRFGFKASIDYGIENANQIPSQYVMALELVSGALIGIKATADFCT